ncbi:MAG: hypothetical protein KDA42_05320 [Planctomycetales bacterium]|nr:hypothetical protein [Planctomycetales bacterium]
MDDPIELAESLREDGKLIWFLCDGDGDYSVKVFVRSPLPRELADYCTDEEAYPSLEVNGPGYFGGMEYMFKDDPSFLRKHPGMCEKITIPNGTYAAKVYRTNVPEEIYETWLLDHAGIHAKRLWDFHSTLAACSAASVMGLVFLLFFVAWTTWFGVLIAVACLITATIGLSKTEAYRVVADARNAYELAYPSYVVLLE